MRRLILIIALVASLVGAIGSVGVAQASSASHACAGTIKRSVYTADRLRAQRGTSCAYARYLVRTFLRGYVNNSACADAAQRDGMACLLFGQYECNIVDGARPFCMDQGTGVTFRLRSPVHYEGGE